MQSSPTVRGDRGAALLVAIAINGWAVWALAHAMRPALRPEGDAFVLRVVWLPHGAPDRPAQVPAPSLPRAVRNAGRSLHVPTPSGAVAAPTRVEPPDALAATRPMSAVYLMRIRQTTDQQLGDAVASQDPLADRVVRLPGRAANRFRMREPMSAARAVAMVGNLFGGSDPAEPCRSNRAEIAALGTQGDSKRLQQELDYERRLCRP